MTGDELVERVDGRHQVERSKGSYDGPGQPDLREERDTAPGIPGNQCPVAQDEPPTLVARFLGDVCKQTRGVHVSKRE